MTYNRGAYNRTPYNRGIDLSKTIKELNEIVEEHPEISELSITPEIIAEGNIFIQTYESALIESGLANETTTERAEFRKHLTLNNVYGFVGFIASLVTILQYIEDHEEHFTQTCKAIVELANTLYELIQSLAQ